uniref:PB1 domain-containing protein n=2 Tax=Heterosigma akashiwo TaxID=2829 RepID=A0A7S3Y180_HETAK
MVYTDDDDDTIMMSSDEDLNEALRVCEDQARATLRVEIKRARASGATTLCGSVPEPKPGSCAVTQKGPNHCAMCKQKKLIVQEDGLCAPCVLGRAHCLRYECDKCQGIQKIPHPMWKYQPTQEEYGGPTWACHQGCAAYTHWRIVADDVMLIPSGMAPESWGLPSPPANKAAEEKSMEAETQKEGAAAVMVGDGGDDDQEAKVSDPVSEALGPDSAPSAAAGTYFVMKSGRYQGQTLYANERSHCLGVGCIGSFSNTSVGRREWLFSADSGLLSLRDGKTVYVHDDNYLYADCETRPESTKAWTLNADGVLSLADGRQIYLDDEGWVQAALPGGAGNTDPSMREWKCLSQEQYEEEYPAPEAAPVPTATAPTPEAASVELASAQAPSPTTMPTAEMWAAPLQQLAEMGFYDQAELLPLLEKHGGDGSNPLGESTLQHVLAELLG